MKKHLTFLVAIFIMAGSTVRAQEVVSSATLPGASSVEDVTMENVVPKITLDTRFGYEQKSSGRIGGFGGDGFLLNVDGKIGKRFSYSLNHSLVSPSGDDSNIFDATLDEVRRAMKINYFDDADLIADQAKRFAGE